MHILFLGKTLYIFLYILPTYILRERERKPVHLWKQNNNFEKYTTGMNIEKGNMEETLFIRREKFRSKAGGNKSNVWCGSGREEIPEAMGGSDNLKHVIEFPSLLEAHNAAENFLKSINHPIKEI